MEWRMTFHVGMNNVCEGSEAWWSEAHFCRVRRLVEWKSGKGERGLRSLRNLVSCLKELVLSSHQVESSLRGMKGIMVFCKGQLVKRVFYDKVTLSRELSSEEGAGQQDIRGDSPGHGNRYTLRWDGSTGLSVFDVLFVARLHLFSSVYTWAPTV